MSYSFHTLLSNKQNYGGARNPTAIKWIVIHYTGNSTDKAVNNCKYFQDNIVFASAHYFVDNTSVYQSVPDNYVAWSVGGRKYPSCGTSGGGKLYGKVTNNNSISVELCSTNGKFHEDTLKNATELVLKLMEKYNIDIDHICRHFDVTGKECPRYWVGNDGLEQFKKRLEKDKVTTTKIRLFGTEKEIKRILKNGQNYMKLQDLNCKELKVNYVNGKVTINGKVFVPKNKIVLDGYNYVLVRELESLGFKIGYINKVVTID